MEVCFGEGMLRTGLNWDVGWVCGPLQDCYENQWWSGEGSLLGGYTWMMDIEGAAIVPSRGIAATSGREACTPNDWGSETAEVKISWTDRRLGGRSSAEGGRAVPKIVTGIP